MCAVYVAGFFAHALYLGKTVYGDGIYYYSWLRSVVVDHDINFSNEYAKLGGNQPITPLGLIGNKYSVGPTILWAPAFLFVHSILKSDGYTLPYQLSVGFISVLSTLVGLLLLWRLLEKFFNKTVSIMTIAALAGTTNLLFYGSIDAVNSHALSFLASCVFLSLLLNKKKQWFPIGVALGFLGLIRTQDFLYAILLIPFLKKTNALKILLGILVALIPQLTAWQLLYGKFWISPYLGGNEGFNFLSPALGGVLFGVTSGLFLFTPMSLLASVGLFAGKIKQIPLRMWMIAVFLLELYFVASWSTWWQGASYSGRMLVATLPILSFGIASVFAGLMKFRWTKSYYLLTLVIPLSITNAILIVSFLLRTR